MDVNQWWWSVNRGRFLRFRALAVVVVGWVLSMGFSVGTFLRADAQPRPAATSAVVEPRYVEGATNGKGRVAVVGDSLVFASTWETTEALQGGGWQAWVDGDIGKTVADRRAMLDEMVRTRPDVIVIELGTNDVRIAAEQPTPELQIAELDRRVGDMRRALDRAAVVRCVVVENVNAHITQATSIADGPQRFNELARRYNREVASTAAQRSNVVLLDWSSRSAGHPDWFDADGMHSGQSAVGRAARAAATLDAVLDCPLS